MYAEENLDLGRRLDALDRRVDEAEDRAARAEATAADLLRANEELRVGGAGWGCWIGG
jgi:cell division septum initiation protein DivIVA